ncbi:MAG: hypothetical protein ACYS1C_04385, partial [Planctomycetota bacterium]
RALRQFVTALKADHRELGAAVGLLSEGRRKELIETHAERAEQTERENRRFARENAQPLRGMGGLKLVAVSLPRPRQPFWAEISAYARQEQEAELSLCHLEGRAVMILASGARVRADLRDWARYVTDLLPAARSIGARASVVPLLVRGLPEDPGLKEEVLGLLAEGAHLLRSWPRP